VRVEHTSWDGTARCVHVYVGADVYTLTGRFSTVGGDPARWTFVQTAGDLLPVSAGAGNTFVLIDRIGFGSTLVDPATGRATVVGSG
jgi:hypothetical protein